MAARKPFLLRVDPKVLDELRAWAEQDLRSLNGQIEFLLRRLLNERKKGRRSAAVPDDPIQPVDDADA